MVLLKGQVLRCPGGCPSSSAARGQSLQLPRPAEICEHPHCWEPTAPRRLHRKPQAWKPVHPVQIPSLNRFLAFSALEMGFSLVGLEKDSSSRPGMQPWRQRLPSAPKILLWSWISVRKECALEKSSSGNLPAKRSRVLVSSRSSLKRENTLKAKGATADLPHGPGLASCSAASALPFPPPGFGEPQYLPPPPPPPCLQRE